jgi:hypothetical protein
MASGWEDFVSVLPYGAAFDGVLKGFWVLLGLVWFGFCFFCFVCFCTLRAIEWTRLNTASLGLDQQRKHITTDVCDARVRNMVFCKAATLGQLVIRQS